MNFEPYTTPGVEQRASFLDLQCNNYYYYMWKTWDLLDLKKEEV